MIQCQQEVTALQPANAEELANIAEETVAEVLHSALRYPSATGGWQPGDIDFREYLDKYRDHELVVIIASVGEVDREEYVCGICGFAMSELGKCPRCNIQTEEIAKRLRDRRKQKSLWRDTDEVFGDAWEVGG